MLHAQPVAILQVYTTPTRSHALYTDGFSLIACLWGKSLHRPTLDPPLKMPTELTCNERISCKRQTSSANATAVAGLQSKTVGSKGEEEEVGKEHVGVLKSQKLTENMLMELSRHK